VDKLLKKRIQDDNVARMASAEVAVPVAWRPRSKRRFPRLCYQRSLGHFLAKGDQFDGRLVHGQYRGGGPILVGHAWIEIGGDVVFDGVLSRFYRLADYYQLQSAVKEAEYTLKEAARLSIATRNYGPWTESERALA
jgi:hypothetical protein